jgi:phage terminase large subunit
MIPCGKEECFDLTVDQANHYITTDQHIINKNSYAAVYFDELPNWPTDVAYRKIRACLRSAHPIPNKRIRCTGNPGGVGHAWVKKRFNIPKLTEKDGVLHETASGTRMFIRSLVWDNRVLLKNDPQYIERLYDVGDEQLVRAWLSGDWDAFVGQFFTSWRNEEIACDPFEIPEGWPLYACLDYGEAAPSAFLLATIDFDANVYIICEYYEPGLAASQHGENIRNMIISCPFTKGRMPEAIYADPSMWTKRKLTELVQHSPADIFSDIGLFLSQANNDRITGWRIINEYLVKGRLKAFSGWTNHLMESMPSLPRSSRNPEDVDTFADDHLADALRYLLAHVYRPMEHPGKNPNHPYLGENVINSLKKNWVKSKKRTILAA